MKENKSQAASNSGRKSGGADFGEHLMFPREKSILLYSVIQCAMWPSLAKLILETHAELYLLWVYIKLIKSKLCVLVNFALNPMKKQTCSSTLSTKCMSVMIFQNIKTSERFLKS